MSDDKRLRIAPKTLANARRLRGPMTPAEKKLWWHLSSERPGGFKFRRQHPVGAFIVDFYCAAAKLAVELDGDTHADQEQYDAERTAWLEAQGLRVIRFVNADVHERLPAVMEAIVAACEERAGKSGLAEPEA